MRCIWHAAVADATSFYGFVSDWSKVAAHMKAKGTAGSETSSLEDYSLEGGGLPSYVWDRDWVFPLSDGTTVESVKQALDEAEDPPLGYKADALTRKLLMARIIPAAVKKVTTPAAAPSRLLIHFKRGELAAMKKAAQKCAPDIILSTNDVLCAHLARCISGAAGFPGRVALVFAAQMRGKLEVTHSVSGAGTGGERLLWAPMPLHCSGTAVAHQTTRKRY